MVLLGAGAAAASGDRAWAGPALSYEEAVRETWAPLREDGGVSEIIRYGTLAANSHNTQPWIFSIGDRRITIRPDARRRCPVVDPGDRHVFASLGGAVENIVHAAAAMGFAATPVMGSDQIEINLESAPAQRTPLLTAIARRQCTRAAYDGRGLANDVLGDLERAGSGRGITAVMITDDVRKEAVSAYVLQGNGAQMRDGAFMQELVSWLRFSETDAAATRDGLFSRASGNPALPAWLARRLLPFVMTERGENEKYRTQIRSSAGVAVFVAERDDRRHWVEAGRACQRFALSATALGLKYAFINQPIEVAMLRQQFTAFLGVGERTALLMVRFGAGPEMPRSLRRPVSAVIV